MNEPINDGGPAFPCMVFRGDDHNNPEYNIGLTLRDYFAGQALAGIAAPWCGYEVQRVAERAYDLADAMIAQRTKETKP